MLNERHCVKNEIGPHQEAQQARDIHTMLVQCWATVCSNGPTLYQNWVYSHVVYDFNW